MQHVENMRVIAQAARALRDSLEEGRKNFGAPYNEESNLCALLALASLQRAEMELRLACFHETKATGH